MKYIIITILGLLTIGCGEPSLESVKLETCTVERLNDTSVQLICPDGSNTIINEQLPEPGVQIVEICPEKNPNDLVIEILLYQNNTHYAFYTQGNINTSRLSELKEFTTYRTTDGRNQLFRIENQQVRCL